MHKIDQSKTELSIKIYVVSEHCYLNKKSLFNQTIHVTSFFYPYTYNNPDFFVY